MIEMQTKQSSILEVVVDFRFDTKVPFSVFLGKVYEDLISIYPIFQDVEAKAFGPLASTAPTNRFTDNNFLVNIGPGIVSVNRICSEVPYSGWGEIQARVVRVAEILKAAGVSEANRVAVQYLNFFQNQDEEFREKLNIDARVASLEFKDAKLFGLNLATEKDGLVKRISTASEAYVEIGGEFQKGQTISLECTLKEAVTVDNWVKSVSNLHDNVVTLHAEILKNKNK